MPAFLAGGFFELLRFPVTQLSNALHARTRTRVLLLQFRDEVGSNFCGCSCARVQRPERPLSLRRHRDIRYDAATLPVKELLVYFVWNYPPN